MNYIEYYFTERPRIWNLPSFCIISVVTLCVLLHVFYCLWTHFCLSHNISILLWVWHLCPILSRFREINDTIIQSISCSPHDLNVLSYFAVSTLTANTHSLICVLILLWVKTNALIVICYNRKNLFQSVVVSWHQLLKFTFILQCK